MRGKGFLGLRVSRVVLASFDLWATLLDTRLFYREMAARLSLKTGLDRAAAEKLLLEAYRAVKEERAAGRVRGERPVEDSLLVAERVTHGLLSPDDLLDAAAEAAYKVDARGLVLPGAREALTVARESGFRVGVVSNVVFWHGQVSRLVLWRAGLRSMVDFQVYADEAGCLKPCTRIFREALERAEAGPGEAVHIGDSLREDALGALMAGMKAVLVAPSLEPSVNPGLGLAVARRVDEAVEAGLSLLGLASSRRRGTRRVGEG